MAKLTRSVIRLVICAAIVASCVSHDLKGPIPMPLCNDVETISFSNGVQPILNLNCVASGCHDDSQGPARDWRDPEAFKAKAFEAKRRILLPSDDADHMPRGKELTLDQIKTISCWVDQGRSINN
jgi:hypothetical protein